MTHVSWLVRVRLRCIQWLDRRRLRRLMADHPGVQIHPSASTNFAKATFHLSPGARLTIGPGVVTERRLEGVRIQVAEGAEVVIGKDTWLRTELQPVMIFAFPGARIEIGEEGFMNGCHLSAKEGITLGRRCMVGPGSRIWDSDQHDLDLDRKEVKQAVRLGNCVWIAADATVLRGVEIGDHSVIGTRALVTRSIPPNRLAFGSPAEPRGEVGDRTDVPF